MQNDADQLHILVVDDRPDRFVGAGSVLSNVASLSVLHPSDVEASDLNEVDMVTVDEFLDNDWADSADSGALGPNIAAQALDGLAVAAALRSRVRAGLVPHPFAVTLHTGELERLAEGLPARQHESLIAAQHDLEWVFRMDSPQLLERMAELAAAASSLTSRIESIGEDFGANWLQVPSEAWRDTAIAQLEDCRPPVHALAENTFGLSFLRWFLHRALPYPTFLVSDAIAANVLGVTEESFARLATHGLDCRYTGPLSSFLGRRWWRAGLQQVLLDCDTAQWDSSSDRAEALSTHLGVQLDPLFNDQAVVFYGADGDITTIDGDPEGAVRLQVDGWPVYADDPWAPASAIRENQLLARLVTKAELADLESRP